MRRSSPWTRVLSAARTSPASFVFELRARAPSRSDTFATAMRRLTAALSRRAPPALARRLTAVGVVGTLLLAAAAGLATGGAGRKFIPAVAAGPRQVPLPGAPPAHGGQPMTTLALGAAELRVPRGYFGLSPEYWALPLSARRMGGFGRILRMRHGPGDEPLMLRIGGDSADHSLFDANVRRLPNALFELTPGWFARASALVRDVSARVILDLNLVADLPRMAELWAHAAQNELPA